MGLLAHFLVLEAALQSSAFLMDSSAGNQHSLAPPACRFRRDATDAPWPAPPSHKFVRMKPLSSSKYCCAVTNEALATTRKARMVVVFMFKS